MTNINTAANAYLDTLKALKSGAGTPGGDTQGGASFGDILKTSLGSAIDAQHKSEQMSSAALVGKANMTEVLQAVNDAEVALNTVLAIRDKLVNAYEQIMRTPI